MMEFSGSLNSRRSMSSRSSWHWWAGDLVNAWFAILGGVALMLCFSMGLWSETMSTLALVLTATVLALAIGVPIGSRQVSSRHWIASWNRASI